MTSYPKRIKALRSEIIGAIPRVPNDASSLAHMEGMHTCELIRAFLTWRMRMIPRKPRTVKFWPPGIASPHYPRMIHALRGFVAKVQAGEDLNPFLSLGVNTRGYILPGPGAARDDRDMVLTRMGLHHFHIGSKSANNPKGRSGHLVFAEVTSDDFIVVALSDHKAFRIGSPESIHFHEISQSYIGRNVPPGQAYMMNPVLSSGHSLTLDMFSLHCEAKMEQLDPQLDALAFVDHLWSDQPIERDGQPVGRPPKPSFKWHFDDLRFGILETKTWVFFCIFQFFTR
jgi:hypothetical protein